MTWQTVRVLLQGTVQGSGVRPALARLAARHGWSGCVQNTSRGVELILSGNLPPTPELEALIRGSLPLTATTSRLSSESAMSLLGNRFRIVESTSTGPLVTPIPRDVAICDECLREVHDPANRRYAYPFISCAQCGPRYSILQSMPFDRERTTLQAFPLCADCRREYDDPGDRRFHAQTICCSVCGPQVWATDASSHLLASRDAAVPCAAEALRSGQIVALRGVGGYQLLADATSSSVVRELRRRKRRLEKPLAVLCRTSDEARALVDMNGTEEQQLRSPQNPIVLIQQRTGTALAREINPGLSDIGLLLPATALHERLVELSGRPLVCTSGNHDGEPLATEVDDAQRRLGDVADLFVHHNREISHAIDDSVVRVIAGRPITIRAGRGIAPLPLPLAASRPLIALGGHYKAAVALANGQQAVLAPHVGDLDTVSAQGEWRARVRGLARDYGILDGREPVATDLTDVWPDSSGLEEVEHDSHPDYFTTRWAENSGLSKCSVWHHHAHIVSTMLEQGWLNRTVLGVAWDGTGLGPDRNIWGGEFLVATATRFQRVGHLRPFVLPGGESAITDLRRLTVALLSQLTELSLQEIADLVSLKEVDVEHIQRVMRSNFSLRTTSCGRLFDAAACLVLKQQRSAFEGHAAMCLEAACDLSATGHYQLTLGAAEPIELDWWPMLRQILVDRRDGVAASVMAMRFHRGLARAIMEVHCHWPELPVVLGGGVFQNRVLVELLAQAWPIDGQPLGLPGLIPPNDGGLAAGQLAVATALRQIKESAPCASEFPVS
jgi:hydrogenase maturation protein HypF